MSETIQHYHHEGSDGCSGTGLIDASVRTPVLLLFGNALHWLLVATLLSLIVSIKLVFPGFLGGISFLGYGRLAPMARDLFLYGWASQAAIAAGIWLMARLCGRPLGGVVQVTLINGAAVLWNLAVLLGTLAILAGYSTGVEWLEYPNWASAMLFLSFLMIGIWAVLLFDRRSGERAETAHWYLVAGFCSFPWVYGTANLLLTWGPVHASAQGSIQAWFRGGLLSLWLLPVAVGVLYALLPRLTGRHLNRRNLAPLGFWLFLFLGGWGGLDRLIGGPVPAWMTSAGVVAGVLFVIPVLIVLINLGGLHHEGGDPSGTQGTAWSFLRAGLHSLLAAGILGAILSLPGVSAFARFTAMTEAYDQFLILGVVSLTLFGVMYEALPALLGRACWSPSLSIRHYWLTFTGVVLLVSILLLSGLFTGLALVDPVVSFLNITSYATPFHVLECAAWLFLLAAAAAASANFAYALAADHLFPKK
jgi:cytochrome c oxidase cbb3-type subunit 1